MTGSFPSSRTIAVPAALVAGAVALAVAVAGGAQEPPRSEARPIPIAAARADEDGDFVPDRLGDTVTVAGRVTSGSEVLSTTQVRGFVQDATGGILLFAFGDERDPAGLGPFETGDSLIATGVIGHFRAQTQLRLLALRVVPGVRRVPEPVALPADASSLEGFEGLLIRTTAIVKAAGRNEGGSYLSLGPPEAQRSAFLVYVGEEHPAPPNLQRFSVGDRVDVIGLLGQFDREPPYDSSYEIYPRTPADVAAVGLPRKLIWQLMWGALAIVTLAALGLFVLRRQVRSRTRELAESERAARASRERLEIVLAAMPVGLWSLDRDLRFTWAEGQRLAELGIKGQDLVGRPVTELLGTDDPAHPMMVAYRRALGGETVDIETEWTGRLWEIRLYPLIQEDEVAGVAGFAMDVSGHRETERRLEEQTAYFRSLFEESPEAIVLVEDDRVLEVNPEFVRMFGYTAEEAVGRPINELVSIPGHEDEAMAVTRQVTGGQRVELEAVRRRKDGSLIQVSLLAKPLEVGGRRRVYGIYRDITEQKNLEAQLLHSQRLEAVGQLAGGVAHDFNNILTAILGHARLLLDEVGENDNLRADLEQIVASGERAADLTRQLLMFSRRQIVTRTPLDLNRVIREMQDLLRRLIEERVEVVLDLADDLPAVHADAGQLQQIVMNLVINARDATPGGGKVVVSTRRAGPRDRRLEGVDHGDWVVLSVRDEGGGMTDDVKARMFEPFFTTKNVGEGTGLGLSTVYGIVDQSGGIIRVDTAPGAGTTISIYLPAGHDLPEQPSADAPAGAEALAAAGGGGFVLLVDDEKAVREVTRRILERAGYQVVVEESGRAALEYCDSAGVRPDLVLTDMIMPGMSGLELAQRLREKYPGIQVLLMTGYADPAAGTLEEHEEVIRKPFDAMTLVRRLRERLALG